MGFIKVGAVLFASLLVGMANASNGNKNNNNKTRKCMTLRQTRTHGSSRVINLRLSISMPLGVALVR